MTKLIPTILLAASLAACAGTPAPTVATVCADVSQLAALAPLVSAADLAIPAAGPALAAANTALASAASGACMNPAAVQALVDQVQGVIAKAKHAPAASK
jgi:hypothetical protein